MKPVENIYQGSVQTELQYMYKTVSFCKRLSIPMTTSQLANRVYNTAYSLHDGLNDCNMEVIQGEDRGSKRVQLAVPPPCWSMTAFLPRMWEVMATLHLGRYKSSANFDKAFVQCELVEDGAVLNISKVFDSSQTVGASARTWLRFHQRKAPTTQSIVSPDRRSSLLKPCWPRRRAFSCRSWRILIHPTRRRMSRKWPR